MPKEYVKIRDSLIKRGKASKEAKRIAAATYNKRHPGAPVGPSYDKRHPVSKKQKTTASRY